ncbi:MAG: aminotransferase [Pseudomonadota bacterium]
MASFNSNLLAAAGSPIMEAVGWVRDAEIPANRPLIDLSQAAPRLPPPESMRQHLAQAMLERPSAHFYGAVLGNDDLRAEIALQWSALYGGDISANQVAVTAGCNQAFCTAIASVCSPSDDVILPVPWYFNHKMWLDMAGIGCTPLPCDAATLPDPDLVEGLIKQKTKAIVLVTPNNPTGAEYPDALMLRFFEIARDHRLLLLVDETYRDFHSQPGAPHTLFQQPEWQDTVAHLYSFSKVYRMTGHRTGALITSAERIAQTEKFLDTVTICPAQSGQIAALYGLRNLADWVAEQRQIFANRREFLTSRIATDLPDWTLHGAGAYFAWVTPPFGIPAPEMAKRLVQEASLLVLPGTMFHPDGVVTQALRIAFANADESGISATLDRLSGIRA